MARPWKVLYQAEAGLCAASYGTDQTSARVALLDVVERREVGRIEPAAECGRTFDLSTDGEPLTTGYWYRTPGVDIWNTDTRERIRSLGPSRVGSVRFDKASRFVVYHSEKGAWAQAIDGTDELRLPSLPGVEEAAFELVNNVLLLPTLRKGLIARLAFDPLSAALVQLDIPSVVHWLRFSPSFDACFLIGSGSRVYCFDGSLSHSLWTTSLRNHGVKGHVYVGTYSGDGSRIGITETLLGEPHFRTIVLDASSGEVVRAIDGVSCGGYPLAGPLIMKDTGDTLDLVSGQVEPGPVSSLL